MKKQICKAGRYLLIGTMAAGVLLGLTACRDSEYNNETGEVSESRTEEGASSDNASEEQVWEYEQEVEIDENGNGSAVFSFSLSDDVDAD